jgi:hypothetical protein
MSLQHTGMSGGVEMPGKAGEPASQAFMAASNAPSAPPGVRIRSRPFWFSNRRYGRDKLKSNSTRPPGTPVYPGFNLFDSNDEALSSVPPRKRVQHRRNTGQNAPPMRDKSSRQMPRLLKRLRRHGLIGKSEPRLSVLSGRGLADVISTARTLTQLAKFRLAGGPEALSGRKYGI